MRCRRSGIGSISSKPRRLSKVGSDGHAERGDFLPPVPLPRRMWAGSRFAFTGPPLRIGQTIHRSSRIKSVEPKTGTTGAMVFVTVEHTVSGPDGVSFVEDHDIVYREAAKPGETQRDPKPAPTDATWSKKIMADPVLLFRFSALTFNGHRIHYDQPYVTGTEGYPGLIVHGPLMGMVQIEQQYENEPGARQNGEVPIVGLAWREQGYAFDRRVTGFKILPGALSLSSGVNLEFTAVG